MRRPKLEFLTVDDVQQTIEFAYDLLETFGVKINNEDALRLLVVADARVDLAERVAYLPRPWSTAPLGGRRPPSQRQGAMHG